VVVGLEGLGPLLDRFREGVHPFDHGVRGLLRQVVLLVDLHYVCVGGVLCGGVCLFFWGGGGLGCVCVWGGGVNVGWEGGDGLQMQMQSSTHLFGLGDGLDGALLHPIHDLFGFFLFVCVSVDGFGLLILLLLLLLVVVVVVVVG
jgi:hypothetical protein